MNTTFEAANDKKPRDPRDFNEPLMISGKKMVKLKSIRSQSRKNVSSYEKIPKIDIPEKELSFINEILGKNISKNSWLLSSFKKRPNNALKTPEKDTTEPKPILDTSPCALPEIKEGSQTRKARPSRNHKKSSCLVVKPKKIPVDFYYKHISLMQESNGYEISKHKKKYKYFIGPGNNDYLINKIMLKKPGWTKVHTYHSAHFIWTQVKKSEIVSILPVFSENYVKNSNKKPTGFQMLPDEEFSSLSPLSSLTPSTLKVYNRIERNYELCSKKRLLINMCEYYKSLNKDPFEHIPLSYHVVNGVRDPAFAEFKTKFVEFQAQLDTKLDPFFNNLWLVKPGESTNRGIGISVCSDLKELEEKLDCYEYAPGKYRTYIIQKYVYRPLLYFGRKFDIRCYLVILCFNGNLQAFFYKDGYLRTSVAEFNMDNVSNRFIHLTNDAVQKKSSEYGKFEAGNKLSYAEFQEYLDKNCDKKISFLEEVYPSMVALVKDSVEATCAKIDPNRRTHSFEILGYDFMIDEFFRPWLIEVNTNPCLALSGVYLSSLIPKMVEDALHIALDQLFISDPCDFNENRFVMIYNRGKKSMEISRNVEDLQSDGETTESDTEAN